MLHKAEVYEVYEVEEQLENGEPIRVDALGIYPEIMNSSQDTMVFFNELHELRAKYDTYFGKKVAAHIIYMYQYLMEMTTYIGTSGRMNIYRGMGCIFIVDIQRWYESLEKIVINDMNKCSVKMYRHKGFIWKIIRKMTFDKLYKKSMLVLIQNDNPKGRKQIKNKAMIEEIIATARPDKTDEEDIAN